MAERVCVVNAGGWGTALSVVLAGKGHDVSLWARRPELAVELASMRENRAYLPRIPIPNSVRITSDLDEAVDGASVVLVTAILRYMGEMAAMLAEVVSPGQLVAHGSKGIDPVTLMRGSQILESALGRSHAGKIAAISGPNLAREVASGMPTATVVACADEAIARSLQATLSARTFRVYTNPDIIGVELCGAMKNVVALAAGMADGLGYGDNSKAAIITRSLAEVGRLVQRMGGLP
ncbi:MAG TPA: NAD(P)H-dependent glycerol-3-phosphate dehydrogenase, partial [Chloroflexota bacterium]